MYRVRGQNVRTFRTFFWLMRVLLNLVASSLAYGIWITLEETLKKVLSHFVLFDPHLVTVEVAFTPQERIASFPREEESINKYFFNGLESKEQVLKREQVFKSCSKSKWTLKCALDKLWKAFIWFLEEMSSTKSCLDTLFGQKVVWFCIFWFAFSVKGFFYCYLKCHFQFKHKRLCFSFPWKVFLKNSNEGVAESFKFSV